jgi:hypothetical protein
MVCLEKKSVYRVKVLNIQTGAPFFKTKVEAEINIFRDKMNIIYNRHTDNALDSGYDIIELNKKFNHLKDLYPEDFI